MEFASLPAARPLLSVLSSTSLRSATLLSPIVIKVGGSTLEDIPALHSLWAQVVRVAATSPVVIVHGGGKAVDALLKRLNMSVERREGLRVTPDDQIGLITGVLAGTVNKQLVAAINTAAPAAKSPTPKAVGLCLGDAGLCRCVKLTRTPSGVPVDLGRVGEVASGDARVITALLRENFVPVVSSIGIDDSGGLLNINADDAAAALASILHASRLVLLTDVSGVRGGDGIVRPTLNAAQISAMIASGEISGGMIPKVRSALGVAQSTRAPVVILSGESADHLANHLAGHHVGTTILPD